MAQEPTQPTEPPVPAAEEPPAVAPTFKKETTTINYLRVAATLAAAISAIGVLLAVAALEPARAVFPGANGKIAFECDREICTVKPDGSDRMWLTNNSAFDSSPTFAPGGRRIAFTRPASELGDTATVIMVMNDDGTNLKQLTSVDYGDSLRPDWQHVP